MLDMRPWGMKPRDPKKWATRLATSCMLTLAFAGCADDGQVGVETSDQTEDAGEVRISAFDGQWYVDILGSDGSYLLASDAYSREEQAEAGAEAILRHGSLRERYHSDRAPGGGYTITLVAENGVLLASRPSPIGSSSVREVITNTLQSVRRLVEQRELAADVPATPERPPACDPSMEMNGPTVFSDAGGAVGLATGTVVSPDGVVEMDLFGADDASLILAPHARVEANEAVRACLIAEPGAAFRCVIGVEAAGGCCGQGRSFEVQLDLDRTLGDDSQPFHIRVEGVADTSSCIDFQVGLTASY